MQDAGAWGAGPGGHGRRGARFCSVAATSPIGLSSRPAGGQTRGGRTGRARLVRCLVPVVVSG